MKSTAVVLSRAHIGINAPLVTVEAHVSSGLPRFNIVGLPETAVRESQYRVRSALLSSHFQFPSRRITINLGPADLPKEGGRFDLPIALSILAATGQISENLLQTYEFVGELTLDGALRPFKGALSCAIASRDAAHFLVLPEACAHEASLVSHAKIFPANHLIAVCNHLNNQSLLYQTEPIHIEKCANTCSTDLQSVIGQQHAKRALEIAAAGNLNLMFIGPPGTGKSLLASCLPNILPPLREDEALTVAAIYSSQGMFDQDQFWQRPFRNPHHSCSAVAIVGGGRTPHPGEITLAHHGVLFLDELPEFDRNVLESLRTPIETGRAVIARANYQIEFPANFQLITAMNPCPCAYLGDDDIECRCTPAQIQRYQGKISGPLLDRIDLFVHLKRIKNLLQHAPADSKISSQHILKRVCKVRSQLCARLHSAQGKNTSDFWRALSIHDLQKICHMDNATLAFFSQAIEKFKFSPRACHRLLRVARTIAELVESDTVQKNHLAEALSFRETLHSEAYKN